MSEQAKCPKEGGCVYFSRNLQAYVGTMLCRQVYRIKADDSIEDAKVIRPLGPGLWDVGEWIFTHLHAYRDLGQGRFFLVDRAKAGFQEGTVPNFEDYCANSDTMEKILEWYSTVNAPQ